jgi:hypothetical protein
VFRLEKERYTAVFYTDTDPTTVALYLWPRQEFHASVHSNNKRRRCRISSAVRVLTLYAYLVTWLRGFYSVAFCYDLHSDRGKMQQTETTQSKSYLSLLATHGRANRKLLLAILSHISTCQRSLICLKCPRTQQPYNITHDTVTEGKLWDQMKTSEIPMILEMCTRCAISNDSELPLFFNCLTLKMKAATSFETSDIFHPAAGRHILQQLNARDSSFIPSL